MGRVLLLLLLVAYCGADPQDSAPGVVDLTVGNWESHFSSSKHLLVEFYAPWCGWCKKLTPVWNELGQKVSEANVNVAIAKFDGTQPDSNDIKTKYEVRGFPTITLLTAGEREAIRYTGDRTVEGFLQFIKQHTGIDVTNPSNTEGVSAEPNKIEVTAGEVFTLDPDNFDAVVLDSSRDVFVKFYAPWCGHCTKMAGAWQELARKQAETSSQVVIAELDASKHSSIGSRFGVRGFPTLKFFSKGDKSGNQVFSGARDVASFQSFVDTHKSA